MWSDPLTVGGGVSIPFTELNNNLGVTQFYGGAGNVATGKVLGGTQDNGTLLYTPAGGAEGWTTEFGGDGGAVRMFAATHDWEAAGRRYQHGPPRPLRSSGLAPARERTVARASRRQNVGRTGRDSRASHRP